MGWLIEAYCGLVHGHCWDRSRISTDICILCGRIRFVSAQEEKLRWTQQFQPLIEELARLIAASPAPTTPAPPLPESRPR